MILVLNVCEYRIVYVVCDLFDVFVSGLAYYARSLNDERWFFRAWVVEFLYVEFFKIVSLKDVIVVEMLFLDDEICMFVLIYV